MTAPDAAVAPELAAAMRESREMRERLRKVADGWEAAAAKYEAEHDGSADGTYRLLLGNRAEMLRDHARQVRAALEGRR